jgi:hypothetical protein
MIYGYCTVVRYDWVLFVGPLLVFLSLTQLLHLTLVQLKYFQIAFYYIHPLLRDVLDFIGHYQRATIIHGEESSR